MTKFQCTLLLLNLLIFYNTKAQVGTNGQGRSQEGRPVREYNLVIDKENLTLGGVTSKNSMTVNGSVPGPTLDFNEGDWAVIHVQNNMDVETSVHWHGLILPNYQDGVPYLTTPPIKPGTTFTYEIPINQSGTYWYHSHTMLQEQRGVYGSIVIQPIEKTLEYDYDLVVMFSDWTNENPMSILKNLKRGNEWYQVKKKTAVPLSRVISHGAFGAQWKFWRDRMESADIADIYYPAFLTNGKSTAEYPDFKPGDKVRLRMINASASTYFWVDFGGGMPLMVSADGVDLEPVQKSRFLYGIAETYDIIVTIPKGKLEITATAQDGSGHTKLHLGSGDLIAAQTFHRPDKIEMMKAMAKMDMKMGAYSMISSKKKQNPEWLKKTFGMHMAMDGMEMNGMTMQHDMNKMEMDHSHKMHHDMDDEMTMDEDAQTELHDVMKQDSMQMNDMPMNLEMHQMEGKQHNMKEPMNKVPADEFNYAQRQKYFNYNFLKAKEKTNFDSGKKVNEYLFNLTGNMSRYVWSINGVPVSETDKISIKKGEITRLKMNNLTMMHHPMHLHGHYFRVINKNGERSPLKHTVNIPPMQEITVEFVNEEDGDWIFHCHILYHMMSGMTRIFSYDTPRDARMKAYPAKNLMKEMNRYYFWGLAEMGSNYTEGSFTASNLRNEFMLRAEGDYDRMLEVEVDYNRYLNDWVRLYAGVDTENENPENWDDMNTVGLAGIKWFTPYLFMADISMDTELRPRLRLDRELLLFSRVFLEGEVEYKADFGWVNDLGDAHYEGETEWMLRTSYMFSKNFSLQGNYNNLYGWGGGLSWRY